MNLTGKIESLHILRGLTAFYVMAGHARLLFTAPFNEIMSSNPSIFLKIQAYLFASLRFGHEAVLIFFVLSGLVIHLQNSKKIAQAPDFKLDYKVYLIRRFRRLFPPLLLSLLYTFALDNIGLFFHLPNYFDKSFYPIINDAFHNNFNFSSLVGNIFLLHPQYVATWGSNGVLWSLKYEWWFYVIYPLFLLINIRSPWLSFGFVLTVKILLYSFTSYIKNFIGHTIYYFDIWWAGTLISDGIVGRISFNIQKIKFLSILFIPGLFLAEFPEWFHNYYFASLINIFFILGIVGLMALFLSLEGVFLKSKLSKPLLFLGDISFSLYLFHFPIFFLLSGFLMTKHPNFHLPFNFLLFLPACVLGVIVGYVFYQITERPFIDKTYKYYYKKILRG